MRAGHVQATRSEGTAAARVARVGVGVGLAVGVWLVVAVASTVVGDLERWPAQFGGPGSRKHVGSELLSKGTVLSPPLFMIFLMAIALLLIGLHGPRWLGRVGLILAAVVAVVGVVGSFGEVVSAPTLDVPRAAQLCGLIGVALSAWVIAATVRRLTRA